MKSLDFLKEGFMEDASEAHQDHEVQMARQECFHAAEHALALHKLLRNISEAQGLEGWVSSKITLANDYLKRVREYLEYELLTKDINDEAPTLTIAEDQESKKKNLVVEYKVSGAEPSSENYTINNIDLNALQNVTSRYYDRPVTIAQSKDNPDLYKINVAMTVGPVDYGSYNAATRTASVAKRMTDKGDQLQKVLQGISEAQSEEERAESERQMQDFLAKGGEIQQVRANRGPRRSGASLASHHIGGMGDARSGRRSQMRGLGSNPTGKLLVAKESEGVAESTTSKKAKDFISGSGSYGANYDTVNDYDVRGVRSLSTVLSGKVDPRWMMYAKEGLWTIEHDSDYPRGEWYTVTVTDPKHLRDFLWLANETNPNQVVIINSVKGVAEGLAPGQAAWKQEMIANGAVKFQRDKHGGGAVDRIVAYNKDGKVVGGFNRKGVAEGIFDFKKQSMPEDGDELKIDDRHVMFDDGGSYYGATWIKKDGSEAYEEFDKSEYTNLDQLKKAIWDEIKYQDQQSVAEGSVTPDVSVDKIYDDGNTKEWHIYRGEEMIGFVWKNLPDTAEGLYIASGHGPGRGYTEEFTGLKSAVNFIANLDNQGVAEGKKSDRYHIVGKDGKPANLASYPDRDSAIKDRDEKYPGAVVQQVGPRGKVKGVAEGSDDVKTQKYEMMLSNGKVKRFTAKDDADAKRIAKGHGAKSVIKMKGDLPGNKIAEQSVAEGLPGSLSKSDYTPGKTVKHTSSNCTTCHGRKSMYKVGGKLFPDNKQGATKVKCPTCKGTGDKQGVAEGAKCNHTMEGKNCPVHGLKECGSYGKVEEMSAGSVATRVNPPVKNKSKVGTLFGGTYKQKKVKEAKQMTFPGENTKPPQRPGDQVRGTEKATKPNPFKHRLVGNE